MNVATNVGRRRAGADWGLTGALILAFGWTSLDLEASAVFTNTPPRIMINSSLQAMAGQVVTITSTNLLTEDAETVDPVEIVYTVGPDNEGPTYGFGTLLLRGVPLKTRDQFTQFDINQHRLSYRAPTVIVQDFDNLPFNVRDADGALASDRGFTVFSIRVSFPNSPPLAKNGRASCPIGGSIQAQFPAENAETAQGLVFRIAEQGQLGVATLVNTNTGAFVYQANTPGLTGADVVRFQVNDGALDSLVAGEFTVVIENQMPAVGANQFRPTEGQVFQAQLQVQDPDRPVQTLQVRVIAGPTKGTLQVTPGSVEFIYTPGPRRFGADQFSFAVSDGLVETPPAVANLQIKAVPEDGEFFLSGRYAGQDNGGIFLVNPDNGDVDPVAEDPGLSRFGALAYDPIHKELFGAGEMSGKAFLGALNIQTGNARLVGDTLPLNFPLGTVIDEDGALWVGDGPGGVAKIDPIRGVVLTNFVTRQPTIVTGISLAPNGDLFVLDSINLEDSDVQVVRISRADGTATVVLEDRALGDAGDVAALPNGQLLICGRGGLFEYTPGQPLRQLLSTNAFEFLPKEMVVAGDGLVYILDFFTGVVRYNFQTGQYSRVQLERNISPQGIALFVLPGSLPAWRQAFFSDFDLADPGKESTVWGDRADPDQDGAVNLAEYALDTNPVDGAEGRQGFQAGVLSGPDGPRFAVMYHVRRTDDALRYTLEASTDLRSWSDAEAEFEAVGQEPASSAFDAVFYRQRQPIGQSALRFFRLKVTRVNP